MKRGILHLNITNDKERIKGYILRVENEDDVKIFNFKNERSSCFCKKMVPETKPVFICDEMITTKNIYTLYFSVARIGSRLKYSNTNPRLHIFVQKDAMNQEEIETIINELKRYINFEIVVMGLNG